MKAIIIAAGSGKRLDSEKTKLPKGLLDINGKTIIQRQINLLKNNNIQEFNINPNDLNIKTKGFKSILGEDSDFNSKRIREIFKGKDDDFSIAVSLNAAAGLIVAEKNKNFKESYQLARDHLLSGKAYSHLEKISNFK